MSHPIFQIILFEPCIPQNTGNIGRLCVGFQARLVILGKPLFSLDDKARRRAGLDYWDKLDFQQVDSLEELRKERVFAISKFSSKTIYEETFQKGDSFLFGKETTGLPQELKTFPTLSLPMSKNIRSYNLANSVAMLLSEATRQISFSHES
jgi:tRNA (cytidine/uridine-2'-O-)-methyltransferase